MRAIRLTNSARALLMFRLLAKTLLVLAFVATSSYAQRWPDEYKSGPFSYHADFRLDSLQVLLKSVSQLQTDVPERLGLGDVNERIHVFLFRHDATYKGYVRKYFPTVPVVQRSS